MAVAVAVDVAVEVADGFVAAVTETAACNSMRFSPHRTDTLR